MQSRWVAMLAVAASLQMAPLAAQECTVQRTPGCAAAAGGKCPLGLLFEDFITTPTGYVVPPVSERPFDADAGDLVVVSQFRVDGVVENLEAGITQDAVQALADAQWQKIAEEQGGQVRITVGQMVRVADEITNFYRERGYLVAKAFIPVQAIGPESLVVIQVMEGRVAEVEVVNADDYSPGILSRPSSGLIGKTPQRDEVETALLYTQDFPGVTLFGSFKPGDAPGDTKLVLQVNNEESLNYSFGMDNYGLESTGPYRARGDLSWNNPFGFGDKLDFTLLQSFEPENTTLGELRYRVPVGPRGLGVGVEANHNDFRVDGTNFGIPGDILEGTITVFRLATDWRFVRTRFLNAQVDFNVASKAAEQVLLGTLTIVDETLNVAGLKLGFDRIDTVFTGIDIGSIRLRQGFGGQTSGGLQSDQETNFTILDLRYNRVQPIGETQMVVLRLRAQETGNRISSLEQFALSGPDAVRAYQVGDALRDTGQFASLEYRVQAPFFSRASGPFDRTWGDLLQFWLFGDYAHGQNTGDAPRTAVLSGYGLSIQFGLPGSFQFLVQGATTASSRIPSDGEDTRFYGEFSFQF